jgi:CRP-like cAMP-binding protein
MNVMIHDGSLVLAGLDAPARVQILSAARPVVLKPRDVLAREGDPATTFYLVQVGHLKLSRLSPDGSEFVIRFVGPGEPFAGIVAIGDAAYPVTATAAEPTRALGWSRDALQREMAAFPQLRANIVAQISQHLTDALTRLQETTTDRVEQRVARALLRLATHGGVPTVDVAGGVDIAHPLTRGELAGLVSTTLFTVSRLLARWESDGLIASNRRRITLLDPAGLAALADPPPEGR